MMLIRTAIGGVLREVREDQFLTLRDLSSKTGISLAYISEVERGQKEASSEVIEDLCGGLGITVQDLLEGAVELIA